MKALVGILALFVLSVLGRVVIKHHARSAPLLSSVDREVLRDAPNDPRASGALDQVDIEQLTPKDRLKAIQSQGKQARVDAAQRESLAAELFSSEKLYGTGAFVSPVYGPKDEGYRKLSVKVYTVVGDGGALIDKIGVADITEVPVGAPPHFLKASPSATDDGAPAETFAFRPEGRRYAATIAHGTLTLTRPGGTPEGTLTVALPLLRRQRNDQIRKSQVVDIDGRPHYALPQGGDIGSALFFDRAAADGAGDADLTPAWAAALYATGDDGTTTTLSPAPALIGRGAAGGFHLEPDISYFGWRAAAGPGKPSRAPVGAPALFIYGPPPK